MQKLVYITDNPKKAFDNKAAFSEINIDISFYLYDKEKYNINNIWVVSREKVINTYSIIQTPCFAFESSLYIINDLNKQRIPVSLTDDINVDSLLESIEDLEDRSCKIIDCLTFTDGNKIYNFYNISKGTLSKEKKETSSINNTPNIWQIFIPDGSNKTLFEMNENEKRKYISENVMAKFKNWYVNCYHKTLEKEIGIYNSNNEIMKYIDCDGVILNTEHGLFDEYKKRKKENINYLRSTYLQEIDWYEWIRKAGDINDALRIIRSVDPKYTQILTKIHSLNEGLAKLCYFRENGLKTILY